MGKKHNIPVGALVELVGESNQGCRLRVFGHQSDCDGSVMYALCIPSDASSCFGTFRGISGGYREEALRVVTESCPLKLLVEIKRRNKKWQENEDFENMSYYL